jgi:hypothetical protein
MLNRTTYCDENEKSIEESTYSLNITKTPECENGKEFEK